MLDTKNVITFQVLMPSKLLLAVSEWKLSPKEQKLNKERNGEGAGDERINKCPAWTEALEET